MELNMSQLSLSQFSDKLNKLMPEIMRGFMRRQADELLKGKITLPQFLILNFLNEEGESKMTGIAHLLEVSTPAATGIVDRLVKYGYIARVFDPQDRRIIKIRLTPKSSFLVNKVNQQKRQSTIDVFGKISDKERNDYLKILMRVRDIITQEKKVLR
jgi:DNA-binding MarR family transcriptional regulator